MSHSTPKWVNPLHLNMISMRILQAILGEYRKPCNVACILIYCIFTWFVELACLSKQRTCFIISSITIQWNLYSCRTRLFCWLSLFAGLGLLWSIHVQSITLTLNTLTSVSIFSILFPTHFLNKNLFNNQKLLGPVAQSPFSANPGSKF